MKFYKEIINQEIFKYLLSQGGVSFLFRITGMILSFFNIWLVLNFYNIETYGIFSLIQTILLITLAIFTLGIQNILIIEVSKNDSFNESLNNKFLLKSMKLVLLISFIPILFLFFFSGFISSIFGNPKLNDHFEFLSLILPFLLFHELILYYFIALKKFVKFGFFMFLLPNILFALFTLIFHKNYNTHLYVTIFYCVSFGITFLVEFVLIFPSLNFNDFNTKAITPYKEIIKMSLPMMFSGLIILLLNWTDVIMLGIMTSEKEVGIYNASFKIGFLVLLIISTLNVIVVPRISEYYQAGETQKLKKLINNTTQLILVLTLPLVVVLLLFGTYILEYLGNDFKDGYSVLVIITISSFFSSICGNVDQILNMTNNQNILMRINITTLMLNIVLNYFFIKLFGINGAAFSSLISTVFLNTYCVYLIKKKLGFYTLF